ncbi:esterase/lipase family protein [Pelagibaculum spongiae]|uniref:Alpha/beta hydrolase n=1 Tax=Pelagibaculum spongiae TaxID=2080658 RepID=A0A2V1H495_9GAMM|nr:hypothetical protein [Pelagibaculum spongiae]PVZ72017.1 hypothetical protein DC094_03075 [Pelagibaculum spongiae]
MAICTIEGCKCKTGAIAVVFVPGIMGSRLKNKASGDVVWDPGVGAGIHLSAPMREMRRQKKKFQAHFKEVLASDKRSMAEKGLAAGANTQLLLYKYSLEPVVKLSIEGVLQTARKSRLIYDLANFWLSNAAERKQILVNSEKNDAYDRVDDLLDVDQGDWSYFNLYTKIPSFDYSDYANRGWGTVSWESYGNFLRFLETEVAPEIHADKKGYTVKTYACGYNWMQSNEKSAIHLDAQITQFRNALALETNLQSEQVKVIVISHSMGGYVTRYAATQLHTPIDLVIHGAMPTHGSPATYANAHHGYGSPAGIFLGINGAEVSAILGFCQGGLELLPNHLYKRVDGEHSWLYAKNQNGETIDLTRQYSGMKIYDFYKDTEKWYSFIETRLLAPELVKETPEKLEYYIARYTKRIDKIKNFHKNLGNDFHSETVLLYNFDIKLNHPSYDKVVWKSTHFPQDNIKKWQVVDDDYHEIFTASGKLELTNEADGKQYHKEIAYYRHQKSFGGDSKPNKPYTAGIEFNIEPPNAAGDGTVHRGAGSQVSSDNIKAFIPIAEVEEISLRKSGYYSDDPQEHQAFFNSQTVREHVQSQINDFVAECFTQAHQPPEFI